MEVASTPAYHQQEFPRQISAMDAVCSLLARHVEACLKGFEDTETRKYISSKGKAKKKRSPYFPASPDEYAWVPAVKSSEFIRTGTVKKRMDPSLLKRKVVADKMDTSLWFEYMPKGNLDELKWKTRLNIIKGVRKALAYLHEEFCHIDLKPANVLLDENMVPKIADEKHGSGIPPSCFGEEAVCSKISEMSPEEFFEIVYENWRNRWKFESSSKQIKRLNQIVLSCLETRKSTKATSSLVSSTQRAVHDILILDSRAAPNMDSVDLVLDSNGLHRLHQHLFRNNLTDEQSVKPRSNRAVATNSSDETTRAPMANKLTDDEAENHR
uniref:Protein kinase domain-containing protein n=1 Tax=Setaria italica TaxID=4555 RepID=K3ZJ77_SETIT